MEIGKPYPPNILRQISLSIESRLSTLSSTEKVFQESVLPYKEALQKSSYNQNFTYNPIKNNQTSTNGNRR